MLKSKSLQKLENTIYELEIGYLNIQSSITELDRKVESLANHLGVEISDQKINKVIEKKTK
jgi:hypothetical protein